jgi:hypothetical protein
MAENAYPPKLFVRPSDADGQGPMREPITIRSDDDAEDLVATCDNAEIAARLCLCWNAHDALVKACKIAEPALVAALGFVRRARNTHQTQMYDAVMSVRAALDLAEKEASK